MLLDGLEAFLGACFSFSVSPKNTKNERNINVSSAHGYPDPKVRKSKESPLSRKEKPCLECDKFGFRREAMQKWLAFTVVP